MPVNRVSVVFSQCTKRLVSTLYDPAKQAHACKLISHVLALRHVLIMAQGRIMAANYTRVVIGASSSVEVYTKPGRFYGYSIAVGTAANTVTLYDAASTADTTTPIMTLALNSRDVVGGNRDGGGGVQFTKGLMIVNTGLVSVTYDLIYDAVI